MAVPLTAGRDAEMNSNNENLHISLPLVLASCAILCGIALVILEKK
jgi:hypothetical protein